VLPARWKIIWLICRLFPSRSISIVERQFQEMRREMDFS
jgi:hypothetical protein